MEGTRQSRCEGARALAPSHSGFCLAPNRTPTWRTTCAFVNTSTVELRTLLKSIMANMALASLRSERQARISRLAEADFDDEVLIAEARKRTKLRDVERGLLEEGLSVPYEDGSAQRNEQVAGESVVQQDVKQEQDLAPDPTAIGK